MSNISHSMLLGEWCCVSGVYLVNEYWLSLKEGERERWGGRVVPLRLRGCNWAAAASLRGGHWPLCKINNGRVFLHQNWRIEQIQTMSPRLIDISFVNARSSPEGRERSFKGVEMERSIFNFKSPLGSFSEECGNLITVLAKPKSSNL